MSPSHLREKYYKEECEHSFSMFASLLSWFLYDVPIDDRGHLVVLMGKEWQQRNNYGYIREFIKEHCDIETMCLYTPKIRKYKMKKRKSPVLD